MKRFNKIYLEISNICNLNCSFCPKTSRTAKAMSTDEFSSLMKKIRPWTDYLYFHIMGEPLCHPNLNDFLRIAGEFGFKVIITTNGTLLENKSDILINAPALHKVNISLHAFEANDLDIPFDRYLDGCFSFGTAAEGHKIIVYRLWNGGGADAKNHEIIEKMEKYFPKPWAEGRNGIRIGEKIFLEYGDKFDWPDMSASDFGEDVFCYGLKDQIGILCDGTVVPCCLDHEGDIPLGNLFSDEMEDILQSKRAQNIYNGFLSGKGAEPLCRRCGFARNRFGK